MQYSTTMPQCNEESFQCACAVSGYYVCLVFKLQLKFTNTRSSNELQYPLLWRRNGGVGVSNHQSHDCLLNRLFRLRSKKTSKFCVTGLCAGNSPVTGEFPSPMASTTENVSIWWHHHAWHKWKGTGIIAPGIAAWWHALYHSLHIQIGGNIKWAFFRLFTCVKRRFLFRI